MLKLLYTFLTIGIVFFFSSLVTAKPIDFGDPGKDGFSPSRGESYPIPFTLNEVADVEILLYTADNNLVRTLSSDKLSAGSHTIAWDGKDEEKIVVPDEAYTVVIQAITDKSKTVLDPRDYSGGEVEKDLKATIDPDGEIAFSLSYSSRVQIRAGITEGPMLGSLLNWQPRAAGKNILLWNGMDNDHLTNLLLNSKYRLSIAAFKLPDHSIITTGNTSLRYAEYCRLKKWNFEPIPDENRLEQRGDQGISPHYYYQRIADADPEIFIDFPESIGKDDSKIPLLDTEEPVPVKVTMNEKDEQFISATKYEVTFFVDFEFMSEEELGFMPITWLWKPNNLKKGKHILTVNVSGFKGQVGVRSVEFLIK
jgi:hypothetical protein